MLIPLKEILTKYGLSPKGVIQVGSHWAEEHEEFVSCGIERFVYIEPCKDAYEFMWSKMTDTYPGHKSLGYVEKDEKHGQRMFVSVKNIPTVRMFNVACGAEEGEMPMYVSHQNQGQSNSLLKPDLHLQQHPEVVFDDAEVVKVVTLDSLPIEKEKYDMLVMDVQGAEGMVLAGATETLKHINIIYTEVNRGQTYAGNMEIGEMNEFLKQHGFIDVAVYWPSDNLTWGDSVFVRVSKIKEYVLNND